MNNIDKNIRENILAIVKSQLSNVTQRGFTLIELLLYMGIFTILITILTGIFSSIIDVQLESKSRSSVDQDGRYIAARLQYDMQSAQSIVSPASAGQTTSSLQISVNSVNYTYSLDGSGNLQLTNNNGTNNLNGFNTQISGLTFTRLGNGGTSDTIRITYTVTSKTQRPSGTETKIYQTTLGLQ